MHIYQGKIIAQVAFNGYFKRKNLLLEQGLELTNLSSCLGWALSFSQVLASLRLITLPTFLASTLGLLEQSYKQLIRARARAPSHLIE